MSVADLDRGVMRVIRRSPGVRADEIADRLGEPVVDVSLSLRRLKRAAKVKRRGNTRATQYTAVA